MPRLCYSAGSVVIFLLLIILVIVVMARRPVVQRPVVRIHHPAVQQAVIQRAVAQRPMMQLQRPIVQPFARVGHLVCNETNTFKALYGRPMDQRGNKWHYYTSEQIDSNLNEVVRLPIIVKNRECMHDWGCDELYDNDEVNVQNYVNTFTVKLYRR